MEFRIADTFLDGLARLTGEEQKTVKTTVFDLQVNPSNPGHQLHRIDRSRDKNFWSVRVGSDIRLIVHKTVGSLLVCYVDHHDKAYAWAERRRLEVHPTTGAAQLVELRETVKEIVLQRIVEELVPQPSARKLFEGISDNSLLGLGVPRDWLSDVRAADEQKFFQIAEHLPAEAAEALLQVAAGGSLPDDKYALLVSAELARSPTASSRPASVDTSVEALALSNAMDHPDAQRRFRLIANHEELERALDEPWDRWMVFLHPDQRDIVEREQFGPARVSGSAGTGKTIVALHRAMHLAQSHPDARVLLATFDEPLANALAIRLRRLVGNDPRIADRIDVASLDTVAVRLYRSVIGKPARFMPRGELQQTLRDSAMLEPDTRVSESFLLGEWDNVVDAWSLRSWEDYRDVTRLGRRTRLREDRRRQLWNVFDRVLTILSSRELLTLSMMYARLAEGLHGRSNPPYDFAVIDEAQDLGVAQIRFLASLGFHRADALFFAGDLGQRIFQQPFSWKALGVDVRGRSRTLHVNYRTSHQIRMQADRLLGPEVTDVDGIVDARNTTISLFNGPAPQVLFLDSEEQEITAVGNWLASRMADNVAAHEIGVFVRSAAQLDRARHAATKAGLPYRVLDDSVQIPGGFASLGTMHLAKGLEFKAVAVMACDDDVLPLQQRIESLGEDGDLEGVYDSERQLLYVACTRARDALHVSGVKPASEFMEDLQPQ